LFIQKNYGCLRGNIPAKTLFPCISDHFNIHFPTIKTVAAILMASDVCFVCSLFVLFCLSFILYHSNIFNAFLYYRFTNKPGELGFHRNKDNGCSDDDGG
jgi:hypothetical protein